MSTLRAALPGLLFAALFAGAAIVLGDLPFVRDRLHVGALLLVILLGMAWRSLAALPAWSLPGVAMAQRPVLRWAVAGLGFRLSVAELWSIGGPALAVVVLSTFSALAFGWWLARRLGIEPRFAVLLGVGGAICGASAVVAADSVVQAEKRDAALAVGVITLLGTVGIFLYPIIGRALGMSDFLFGVWDGASLHEMAQVVAAGFGVSDEAARVATVVKLARIALLAPIVLLLGAWLARSGQAGHAKVAPVPWFLVVFVLLAGLASTGWIPAAWLDVARRIDLWLLCVGMAGVGLVTGAADLKAAGPAPILAAALQWVLLATLSYGLALIFVR